MLTVFKFPIPIADEFRITLHQGAEILHVACQDSGPYPNPQPFLWVLFDTDELREEPVPWRFALRGAGHPCDGLSKQNYIATFQQGAFVWHLFRRPE